MLSFLKLEKELKTLRFDVFDDMRRLLKGEDRNTTCIWNACDPYTTKAVHGLEGNGQKSNCGRTNKDGIDFVKADTEGFERYIALYQTPQENGGCRGCRFFLMCKGQCPGTSINRDWHAEPNTARSGRVCSGNGTAVEQRRAPLSVRPDGSRSSRRSQVLGAGPNVIADSGSLQSAAPEKGQQWALRRAGGARTTKRSQRRYIFQPGLPCSAT
jgi:uncharacterized protein